MTAMWNQTLRLVVRLLPLCAIALSISCGGGNTNATPPQVVPTLQSIAVGPAQATVAAGLTMQFKAQGQYSDGSSSPLTSVSWSSSDKAVATIDANGLATTLKQGSATITASSGSVSGPAALTVGPPIPTALNILPANSSVLTGTVSPTKLSAVLTYSDSSTQDISSSATWSVGNSLVASVDNLGNVTAYRVGYSAVNASSSTFTATAAFAVTAEPRYLYFMANAGRIASKAVVDVSGDPAESGALRMTGYIPTNANNYAGFHCATIDPLGRFLYVGSSVSNGSSLSGEIQIYSIDPVHGNLTPLAGSPFPQTAPVDCLEFLPTGNFAYAASSVNNSTAVLTYSVDQSMGLLTLAKSTSLPGIPSRVAIDPLGQYLYFVVVSTNFQTASAVGYSINSLSGALTPIPSMPLRVSNLAGTFSFHPSGTLVYLNNSGGASIDAYSVDRSSGTLRLVGTVTTCTNPTAVRFSPLANVAYTACLVMSSPNPLTVESFNVAANGTLSLFHTSSTQGNPLDLVVDPSGQFLYVNGVLPYIDWYQIGSDGSANFEQRFGIPPNPGTTMALLGGPASVLYTPTTAYISSTSSSGSALSTYALNSNGALTLQRNTAVTNPPFSLSLWPWGTDIAMASAVAPTNLVAFPLSNAGLPLSSDSFGNAAKAGGVAIDPSGQFAYETDSVNGLIYTYMKTSGSWQLLTYVGTTTYDTFAAGAGAGPIVIDPSGLLVYVANQVDNTISAYQYWGTSAELFESKAQFVAPYTDGSPFPVGATPIALAIDPLERYLYVLGADQTLRSYAIDYYSGGHIAKAYSVPLAGSPTGLAVDPRGQFVYTSDSTGVNAFSVNAANGALTPVALSPAITTPNINGVYAEPSGQYLYVTTGSTSLPGAVYGYAIGPMGNLTALPGNPVLTSIVPTSMAFADDIQ
jgi:6-phosphogluconolactonase (cycloisomerase 2 family)